MAKNSQNIYFIQEKAKTILNKLLNIDSKDPESKALILNDPLKKSEMVFLCEEAQKIFLTEPSLLELLAPVKIIGDVHGQFEDVLRIFKSNGFPPKANYLFLGDYVDRGPQSIETIAILLTFKILFPYNFFLLRGNHEASSVNRHYGFHDECLERFNVLIWRKFCECFNCMPICALIENKIFCTFFLKISNISIYI